MNCRRNDSVRARRSTVEFFALLSEESLTLPKVSPVDPDILVHVTDTAAIPYDASQLTGFRLGTPGQYQGQCLWHLRGIFPTCSLHVSSPRQGGCVREHPEVGDDGRQKESSSAKSSTLQTFLLYLEFYLKATNRTIFQLGPPTTEKLNAESNLVLHHQCGTGEAHRFLSLRRHPRIYPRHDEYFYLAFDQDCSTKMPRHFDQLHSLHFDTMETQSVMPQNGDSYFDCTLEQSEASEILFLEYQSTDMDDLI